jgi:SAM-dependent methyltransferase
MTNPPLLTDRPALLRNRGRASEFFLQQTVADEIQERLIEVNRSFTDKAVVTGFEPFWRGQFPDATIAQDQDILDLPANSFDLVIHAMSLHWANDPIGQMVQCRHALRPDGLFFGVFFGGQTLHELRTVLAEAESRVTGGLSPRIAPMGEIRDLGSLLQRAGFALPVADSIPLNVSYPDPFALMRELRAMGEGNALNSRLKTPTKKAVFAEAARLYQDHFGDADGRIPATFEVIVLTGWSPDESQQKPLRPGSAKQSLADALGSTEFKLPKDN